MLGTLMYQQADYQQAIELAAAGKLSLKRLVTDTFPFERYLEAYEHIERVGDKALKVMITL